MFNSNLHPRKSNQSLNFIIFFFASLSFNPNSNKKLAIQKIFLIIFFSANRSLSSRCFKTNLNLYDLLKYSLRYLYISSVPCEAILCNKRTVTPHYLLCWMIILACNISIFQTNLIIFYICLRGFINSISFLYKFINFLAQFFIYILYITHILLSCN